ncbi:MAG TPA: hypothetical protein VFE60_21320 [Roseiarcus sp.]|nr:hypothetical protein [Roseiarcus sp.]
MTALEALALSRAEGSRSVLPTAPISSTDRAAKRPSHVLEALRATKPESVALPRWRVLHTYREHEHVRSFGAQMVSTGRGLIPRVERRCGEQVGSRSKCKTNPRTGRPADPLCASPC